MKKITLFSLILFSFVQIILAQGSSVTFFSQNGERFYVILDGVRQNDLPGTNIKVTDLDRPNYRVTIIFDDANINNINKNVFVQDMDGNMTNSVYNVRRDKKGNMDFRLSSFSEVSAAPAAKEENVVKYHAVENPLPQAPVQKNPQAVETTKTVTTTTTTTGNPSTNVTKETVNINVGGMGIGTSVTTQISDDDENISINMDLGGLGITNVNATTTTKQTVTTTTTTTNQPATTPAPAPAPTPAAQPVAQGCVTPMSSADFSRAKTSVQNQSFSESRMKTAKQFTRANCLNVNQIREIMDLFSFDDDKLEYAKFAYDFCTDKRNYFQLSDGFKFSSSSDSLNDFLDLK
jgi:hypothetical protein